MVRRRRALPPTVPSPQSLAALAVALLAPLVACHPSAGGGPPDRAEAVAAAELDRAVAAWQAEAGVVVVLDRDTGALRAMVGRTGAADDDGRAAREPIVTGSTLKTFTVALSLAAGVATPDDVVDCATRAYGADTLEDAAPHGPLSVADVLAVSSNVGTSRLLDRLGLPALTDGLHRLHLDDPPARLPVVDDPASFQAALLAGGELAELTPLALAAAYGAVFRDGVYRAPAGGPPEPVLPAEVARTTVGLLERVVSAPVGTGGAAALPGHRVAGKTGTADLGDGRIYASFVGTVLDGPPVVILVGLVTRADGASGGKVAAPTFARIAAALER